MSLAVGRWYGLFDQIEACPPEMEGVVEDCDDVRHVGDEVCLAGNEGFDLRQERLVEISLGLGFGFDEIEDFSDFEFAVEMGVGIGIKGGKLFVPRFFWWICIRRNVFATLRRG